MGELEVRLAIGIRDLYLLHPSDHQVRRSVDFWEAWISGIGVLFAPHQSHTSVPHHQKAEMTVPTASDYPCKDFDPPCLLVDMRGSSREGRLRHLRNTASRACVKPLPVSIYAHTGRGKGRKGRLQRRERAYTFAQGGKVVHRGQCMNGPCMASRQQHMKCPHRHKN